jgi:hypothetical protein
MFLLLQIAVILAMLTYLWQCQVELRRRNLESWDSLTIQLRRCSENLERPWGRFQKARALLEMADYAELNSAPAYELLNLTQIAAIRKSAREERISATAAILRSVIPIRFIKQA